MQLSRRTFMAAVSLLILPATAKPMTLHFKGHRGIDKKRVKNLMYSIAYGGLHAPILVTSRGEILDGVHRFVACNYLGIEPRIKVI